LHALTRTKSTNTVSAATAWIIAGASVVVAVAILVATGSVDIQELLTRIVFGMSYGCVYALLAVGLVLTYKTSGVFNLAYGAQAFVSGAIYYDMRVRHGMPIWVALLVSVFVAAPLLGFLLDRALFRYLRGAPPIAKLVTALALLVAIPQVLALWFDESTASGTQGIVPKGDTTYNPFGDVFVNRNDLATISITVAAVLLLTLLFRYTSLGLRMRAVVESGRLTELAGINADLVSMSSWVLCSTLAGLAGVLLAPLFARVSDLSYTTLVVVAISAAVVGSLNSIPLAFFGGLGLGIIQQILDRYLPTGSTLASNIRPALPFLALFLVLIFSPSLRNRREVADPLAGVDPPPPALVSTQRSALLTTATRVFGVVVGLIAAYYLFFHASDVWLDLAIRATMLSVIFLSITVITGMAGQISLSQATFAGIGACATAQLATGMGMSVLVAMVVAALISALIGGLLAIPALRLGGIFLSLATFAFALFFDNVMAKFGWIGGGAVPIEAPRPTIGPINFDKSDKAFFLLSLAILVIVALIVLAVRNGTTGRYLDALRGSETAAASIGINANRARITVFALAAGIAGLGGGLVAMYERAANYNPNFVYVQGLIWVVLVVSLGSRTIEGAIQAAAGLYFFQAIVLNNVVPWTVNHVQPWYHMGQPPQTLGIILLTLGAFTYAKHPEGILEFNKRKSLDFIQRQIDKRARNKSTPEAPVAVPVTAGSPGS
jgi:branched-chain amino acid transport system permease protein